ncbi:MAG TPA: hypothetical protein VG962_16090, partial [Steroidobacteraceae bacterium]|nr:hypothetical protein [Steroidobacteraceae bacterium]
LHFAIHATCKPRAYILACPLGLTKQCFVKNSLAPIGSGKNLLFLTVLKNTDNAAARVEFFDKLLECVHWLLIELDSAQIFYL